MGFANLTAPEGCGAQVSGPRPAGGMYPTPSPQACLPGPERLISQVGMFNWLLGGAVFLVENIGLKERL